MSDIMKLRQREIGVRAQRRSIAAFCYVAALLICGRAMATSPCYQIDLEPNAFTSGWGTDPAAQMSAYAFWCGQSTANAEECVGYSLNECGGVSMGYGGYSCTFAVQSTVVTTWPSSIKGTLAIHVSAPPPYSSFDTTASTASWAYRANPNGCKVYASAIAPPAAQCGPTCNGAGDPINPGGGGMYRSDEDLKDPSESLTFRRFYNSTDGTSAGGLSTGWRYSFSRTITPRYEGTGYAGGYVSSPYNSSLYTDEAIACASGFAEIKGRVSNWANATASYANGVCTLSVGSTAIGTLALLYTSPPTPDPSTEILIGYDATRDDGQVVSFLLQGGVITPPPGISLRLQQTSGGFTLKDNSDNVETYDSTGKLSTVTTRAGVTQTLSYDNSGRLNGVMDPFGHGVTFTYNTQGQLSQVSRQ